MQRHLLTYWPWEMVCYEFEYVRVLAHDASNKFLHSNVAPGDIVWYVTVPVDEGRLTGRLFLFGRLEVDAILHSNEEAQKYLEQTFGLTYEVRDDASIHIFARPGTQETYNLVDITALAGSLRFESSSGRDRLTVDGNGVANTFELRSNRTLTAPSVELLYQVWQKRVSRTSPPEPDTVLPIPTIEPDEKAFPEGAIKQRLHLARELNRGLVALAKRRFKEQHDGRLFCQVCDFDFGARYGPLGDDYIEAHHTVPISELSEGSTTRIEDLAMVCANCHRMLHRRRPWLSMDELKRLLA
jgi:hypothetical protein